MNTDIQTECRLCEWRGGDFQEFYQHLRADHEHEVDLDRAGELTWMLHASKDTPDHSENTAGCYDQAKRLLGIGVVRAERAADDPMRFGG